MLLISVVCRSHDVITYSVVDNAQLGHILNEFVRNSTLSYLDHNHAEVRGAAAYTCCTIFARDPICFQTSDHAIEIISDVLDKLLIVGVADRGSFILPLSDLSQ